MKKIKWEKYLIELFVVFISITAAFLLNSWRENKICNELEKKYLNSIKNDVWQDSISINSILKINNNKYQRFKNYLEKNSENKQPLDSAIVLFKDILSISDFSPKTNTYESMKFSGNLNLISSYEIREQITNYYESFEDIIFQQKIIFDFINNYGSKFVIENVNIIDFNLISNKEDINRTKVDNLLYSYYAFLIQIVKFQKEIQLNNIKLLNYLNQ